MPIYSRADLTRVRDEHRHLIDVPPDAEHDTPDCIGYWNGERFVTYYAWLMANISEQCEEYRKNPKAFERPKSVMTRSTKRK